LQIVDSLILIKKCEFGKIATEPLGLGLVEVYKMQTWDKIVENLISTFVDFVDFVENVFSTNCRVL
jgi:hypothetical protein